MPNERDLMIAQTPTSIDSLDPEREILGPLISFGPSLSLNEQFPSNQCSRMPDGDAGVFNQFSETPLIFPTDWLNPTASLSVIGNPHPRTDSIESRLGHGYLFAEPMGATPIIAIDTRYPIASTMGQSRIERYRNASILFEVNDTDIFGPRAGLEVRIAVVDDDNLNVIADVLLQATLDTLLQPLGLNMENGQKEGN